ncbi:MAG: ComEA family DNA-binding protein [Pseudoflavonifractor sp.]
MKISKLEFVTLLLTAALLAFAGGWFFRGNQSAAPIQVETVRTLPPVQVPQLLPAPSVTPAVTEKININIADEKTLQSLPGIGKKRAADIVAYREAHGNFRIVEDITKVSGIGESTLAELLPYITAE